jgi:hypothetical protein
MRKTGLFATIAAGLLAAQLGCHGTNQVQGPKNDEGKEVVTQGEPAACEVEVALACGEGMVDGCASQLTSVHICMPAEEQASQPCAQEIARECGEGLIDACLMDPPVAATHVCVSAASEPSEPAPGEPDPIEEDEPAPASPESGEG